MERNGDEHIETIERAMVAIRRSQSRRTLARLAAGRQATGSGDGHETAGGGREAAGSGGGRETAGSGGGETAASAAPGAGTEVLDVIEEAEEAGDAATVTSVATALNIDQPRASKLVAAAVAAGLVRREADQADGRRALLVRTPAGRRLSAEIHGFRQRIYAEAMNDWPAVDRAEFARLLAGFVESLRTVTR
ncbi:MarR family transcriptional regulator [Nonomuraea sp. NPDC003804]|uniref:MarR family winged helix-turn-helix transcriptional regulator n=1 Tax=Nonomuraea sp. NPDC003804 TaxID=3154547 RepID=UPI0033B33F70